MGQIFFKKKKEKLTNNFDSLFDISAVDIEGQEYKLGDLAKGCKCIMVVNVASKWSLTNKHYQQLVKIHQEYRDKGFEIFAFPCNQFLSQESCSNEHIKKFVKNKYGVEFKMFSKIEVNGKNTHDVFKFCRENSPLFDEGRKTMQSIPWNFTKFLINDKGQVEAFFTPKEDPEDWIDKIKEMLGE